MNGSNAEIRELHRLLESASTESQRMRLRRQISQREGNQEPYVENKSFEPLKMSNNDVICEDEREIEVEQNKAVPRRKSTTDSSSNGSISGLLKIPEVLMQLSI